MTRELTAGESLRVTSGSIVAFASSVAYSVAMQSGVKNVVFGGEVPRLSRFESYFKTN